MLRQDIVAASTHSDFPGDISPTEQLLSLDRIRYLDGVPVARLKNWVRLRLAPGIDTTDFTTTALFAALDATVNGQVSSGRRTFEAVLPEGDVAQSLRPDRLRSPGGEFFGVIGIVGMSRAGRARQ